MQPAHDEYVTSFPMIFGGPSTVNNGQYSVIPPWNGPCEMMIMSVSSSGAAGGAAYISQSGTLATAMSSIATTQNAGASGTPGLYIDGNSPPAHYAAVWFPIDGPLTMIIANNTTGILITCVFRRRRSQTLPQRMHTIFDQPAPVTQEASHGQSHTLPNRGSRKEPSRNG